MIYNQNLIFCHESSLTPHRTSWQTVFLSTDVIVEVPGCIYFIEMFEAVHTSEIYFFQATFRLRMVLLKALKSFFANFLWNQVGFFFLWQLTWTFDFRSWYARVKRSLIHSFHASCSLLVKSHPTILSGNTKVKYIFTISPCNRCLVNIITDNIILHLFYSSNSYFIILLKSIGIRDIWTSK